MSSFVKTEDCLLSPEPSPDAFPKALPFTLQSCVTALTDGLACPEPTPPLMGSSPTVRFCASPNPNSNEASPVPRRTNESRPSASSRVSALPVTPPFPVCVSKVGLNQSSWSSTSIPLFVRAASSAASGRAPSFDGAFSFVNVKLPPNPRAKPSRTKSATAFVLSSVPPFFLPIFFSAPFSLSAIASSTLVARHALPINIATHSHPPPRAHIPWNAHRSQDSKTDWVLALTATRFEATASSSAGSLCSPSRSPSAAVPRSSPSVPVFKALGTFRVLVKVSRVPAKVSRVIAESWSSPINTRESIPSVDSPTTPSAGGGCQISSPAVNALCFTCPAPNPSPSPPSPSRRIPSVTK
mmetsp:Transcript_5002/g.18669  ORF Transcript_5002/g.18669 Transcript_5002/m.18669 type:complete len:354 (+) Transcript_5002:1407-2468(+)